MKHCANNYLYDGEGNWTSKEMFLSSLILPAQQFSDVNMNEILQFFVHPRKHIFQEIYNPDK